jgi:hypothetical protein
MAISCRAQLFRQLRSFFFMIGLHFDRLLPAKRKSKNSETLRHLKREIRGVLFQKGEVCIAN